MGIGTDLPEGDRGGPRQRRVLVLFGNIPLLGQERGNIQVFYALRRKGVDALFVTNRKWGGVLVQPILDSLDLKWSVATYGNGFRRGMTFRDWVKNMGLIVSGSVTLFRLILKYKPTHIHICNVSHFINFFPVMLLTRVPLIHRIGDVPAVHRRIYRVLWTRIIVPKASHFVCVSEYVRSSILALGVPESKCSVIYSEAPVRVQQQEGSADTGVKKGRQFTILYVGQLTREKGVNVLVGAAIRMCQSNENVEFLIAGDYEWRNKFALALKSDVQAAGLTERIRFLGYVDAIPELFRISNLHLLPSVCEDALPNVVIEAKHASVASVVFPSGGVPEIVEHGSDGYICDGKTEAGLIAGIEYYLASPERASAHGRNAKASLEKLEITRFDDLWDVIYAES